MTDFLSRLAARALGMGPTVKPLVAARFSPRAESFLPVMESLSHEEPQGFPESVPSSAAPSQGPPAGSRSEGSAHRQAEALGDPTEPAAERMSRDRPESTVPAPPVKGAGSSEGRSRSPGPEPAGKADLQPSSLLGGAHGTRIADEPRSRADQEPPRSPLGRSSRAAVTGSAPPHLAFLAGDTSLSSETRGLPASGRRRASAPPGDFEPLDRQPPDPGGSWQGARAATEGREPAGAKPPRGSRPASGSDAPPATWPPARTALPLKAGDGPIERTGEPLPPAPAGRSLSGRAETSGPAPGPGVHRAIAASRAEPGKPEAAIAAPARPADGHLANPPSGPRALAARQEPALPRGAVRRHPPDAPSVTAPAGEARLRAVGMTSEPGRHVSLPSSDDGAGQPPAANSSAGRNVLVMDSGRGRHENDGDGKPSIQVFIGSIEVQAVSEPLPEPRRTDPAKPAMSLEDYLDARTGGQF